MKLFLDENNLVISYVTFSENYDELEGIEYLDEVPEDFENNHVFYAYDNGKLVLQEELKNNREQARQEQQELFDIEKWFTWYDVQCAQYVRSQRRKQKFNRDIEELDNEAEEKAKRLNFLRSKYQEEEIKIEDLFEDFLY